MTGRFKYFLLGLFCAQALAMAFTGDKALKRSSAPGSASLAVSEFYRGEYVRAEAIFKARAFTEKKSSDILAAFLFERQDYSAAEKVLADAIGKLKESVQNESPRWYWLARAQANQGHWGSAQKSLLRWKGLSHDPEALRLYAETADATGNSLEAKQAWDAAVTAADQSPGGALTHYKAGLFYQRQGLSETAASLYRQAEKLDGNYTQVHETLAQIYESQKKISAANSRLERAAGFDRDSVHLRQELARLQKKYPSLKKQAKKDKKAQDKVRFQTANKRVEVIRVPAGTPLVRVGLVTEAPSFKFRTGAAMDVYRLKKGKRVKTGIHLRRGAVYDVALRGRKWRLLYVSAKGGRHSKVILRFSQPVRLIPRDKKSTFRLFDVSSGAGYYWASTEDRFYRGDLELMPRGVKGVTAVNTVNMEEYLMGVVPAEIPPRWPQEALKAQAIAARTHAWSTRGRFRDQGFDLCPTQQCAVYRGAGAEHPNTNAAVKSTLGQVLENPATSKLLPVFYMSNSGGHTQDPGDAWKWNPDAPSSSIFDGPAENPYADEFPLRPDYLLNWLDDRGRWPIESYSRRLKKDRASNFRWIMQYDADRLSRYVSRRHKKIGKLLAVETMDRSSAGYVKRVKFIGDKGSSVGSSDYIRSAIKGLKSTLFYVETRRDKNGLPLEFLFHGGGWGHGVGLCQTGAAGMAEQNFKGEEILTHYFPGGRIRKRY